MKIFPLFSNVRQFAGQTVLYKTKTPYFGSKDSYSINGYHVAKVSDTRQRWTVFVDNDPDHFGYLFTRLVNPRHRPSGCNYSNYYANCGLSIRLPNQEEQEQIEAAQKSGQAIFEKVFSTEKHRRTPRNNRCQIL